MSEYRNMARRARYPSSKEDMQEMNFGEFMKVYYAVLLELMRRLPHIPKFMKGIKPVVWKTGDFVESVTVLKVMIKYAYAKAPKKSFKRAA